MVFPGAIRAEERQALSGPKRTAHAIDGAPPTEHPDEVMGLDRRRGGGLEGRFGSRYLGVSHRGMRHIAC
ncbi:MAG: hypothetical protein ACKOH8_04870, partial [Gemmatimonadota bacterium]